MRTKGFSLIEVIVVMAVLALLSALALPLGEMAEIRAREKQLRTSLRDTRWAIDRYRASRNDTNPPKLPLSIISLTQAIPTTPVNLLKNKANPGPFLPGIPKQSFSGSNIFQWDIRDGANVWHLGITDPNQVFAAGIYDIRVPTGAMKGWLTAIDGSLYEKW